MEIVEELTVEEFLAFHFALKPLRDGLHVGDVLDRIELTHARGRRLFDCSSGMRQRVLLSTALYGGAPLVLLDEPTVTLDEDAGAWFQRELAWIKSDRLLIIASNDEDDLRQCTRRIVL